jgi:hypothetical protein
MSSLRSSDIDWLSGGGADLPEREVTGVALERLSPANHIERRARGDGAGDPAREALRLVLRRGALLDLLPPFFFDVELLRAVFVYRRTGLCAIDFEPVLRVLLADMRIIIAQMVRHQF